jgi:hypothetical protein
MSKGTFVIAATEVLDCILPSLKLCGGGMVHLGSDPKEIVLWWVAIWGDCNGMPRRVLDIFVARPVAAESRRYKW